jgi:hypothetical protein
MTIDVQAPALRRWGAIAAGLVVCGIVLVALSPRDGPTPLPSGVAREVEQHAEASAIDTMEIHRLERAADSAAVKERAAIVVATVRAPSGISIDDFRAAMIANAHKDTALAWARVEAASLDTALARSEVRAARADTVIAAVTQVAESREAPCRVLWVVPCPSRMIVMAGTAVLTLVAVGRR